MSFVARDPLQPAVGAHPAGDELRDKLRKNFLDALDPAAGDVPGCDPPAVAAAIEAAMFSHFKGTTKDYKVKYRSLGYNLKDPNNPDLRRR